MTPRTFSTGSSFPGPANRDASFAHELYTLGPTGELVTYHPSLLEYASEDIADDFNSRPPDQLSEAALQAFTEAISDAEALAPVPMQPDERDVTHFSQSGIVHLAPLDPASLVSPPRSLSIGSSRAPAKSVPEGPIDFPTDREEGAVGVVHLPSTQPSHPASPTSGPASAHASSRSTAGTSTSDGPHITFRYTHLEDENGHHLIVGREGSLTRCEDEVCFPFLPRITRRLVDSEITSRSVPLALSRASGFLLRLKRMRKQAIL